MFFLKKIKFRYIINKRYIIAYKKSIITDFYILKGDIKLLINEDMTEKKLDFNSRVQKAYKTLSETGRKIADNILANTDKTIHLTITQMADACGVSEASVVRFSKSLGYDGYNEMKIYMASEMMPTNYWMQEDIKETDSPEVLIKKVFSAEMQAIQSTMQSLDIKSFERAVDMISRARRVEFYAFGNTRPIIYDSHYRFLCIGVPAFVGVDVSNSLIQATMLTPRDVAIGVSHSGSTKNTVSALESAREAGATTICITGFRKSPITKVADICLISESNETMFTDIAMTSRIAQTSILDALYVGVAFRRLNHSKEHMKMANKIMAGEKY